VPRAHSAGVLLYRWREGRLEVLLVHPGGPFWARKDDGAWSIPKGEFGAGETPEVAARREFTEETGAELPASLLPLPPVAQSSRKIVHAFAAEGDLDPAAVRSNDVSLEWPPHSGRTATFPEIDRAAWFAIGDARRKILAGQRALIDALCARLEAAGGSED
jgi:predicted NUDIX family NTP pyrophosphohydrolase